MMMNGLMEKERGEWKRKKKKKRKKLRRKSHPVTFKPQPTFDTFFPSLISPNFSFLSLLPFFSQFLHFLFSPSKKKGKIIIAITIIISGKKKAWWWFKLKGWKEKKIKKKREGWKREKRKEKERRGGNRLTAVSINVGGLHLLLFLSSLNPFLPSTSNCEPDNHDRRSISFFFLSFFFFFLSFEWWKIWFVKVFQEQKIGGMRRKEERKKKERNRGEIQRKRRQISRLMIHINCVVITSFSFFLLLSLFLLPLRGKWLPLKVNFFPLLFSLKRQFFFLSLSCLSLIRWYHQEFFILSLFLSFFSLFPFSLYFSLVVKNWFFWPIWKDYKNSWVKNSTGRNSLSLFLFLSRRKWGREERWEKKKNEHH